MSLSSVRVVATFTVKPDKVEGVGRIALEALVRPSRKDPGCLRYDLCQDLSEPTRFAMIEEWESEAALEAHLAQPWLNKAIEQLGPMLAGRPVVARMRDVSGE
jgi:quinol monooxygenase YgiN